ncbi:carnitine transporter [Dinochytrium kinnereticum]|nr:carnitine transporter [Dinochytrium kinnereticum]
MQSGGFGYTSTLQASKHILATDGWVGLYRGVLPVLAGAGPVMGVCFFSYTWARRVILDFSPSMDKSDLAHSKDWKDALTIPQIAAAGAVASIPTAMILGPAERIKILLQVERTGESHGPQPAKRSHLRESLRSILRVWKAGGGIFGLYRGAGLTVLRDIPGDAAYFATFEGLKRALNKSLFDNGSGLQSKESIGFMGVFVILLSGGLAGCANWCVCIPIDSIKTQWQQSPPGSSFVKLMQKQTFFGLYRGLGPILLRAFPASGAFFLGVESSTSLFKTLVKDF